MTLRTDQTDNLATLGNHALDHHDTNVQVNANTTNITALQTSVATKAPLASPALTGTPTAPTAAPGTNSTQVATTAYTDAAAAAGTPAKSRAVTVTIAPTGTAADYNTTGTNDHTVFNTAITALNSAGGGTIAVRPGAYSGGGTVTLKSNVYVIFEPGSTWTLANGVNADAFSTGTGGVSNILVEGLTLAGNASNQSAGSGVNIQNFTNVFLRRLTINNAWRNGIGVDGTGGTSDGLWVQNCIISSNGLTSGATGGNGISITNNPSNVFVQGNRVHNSGSANIAIEGTGTHITIDGNFCDTSGQNALAVADNITGYDHSNSHITITNNQCYNGGNHNMHFAGSDIIVSGNQLDTSVQDGIRIASTANATVVNRFAVTNNIVDNSGNNGIYILNADNGLISGNIINGQGGSPLVTDNVTYTAQGVNAGSPTIDFGRTQTAGTPTATNIRAWGAKVNSTNTNGSVLTLSGGTATGNGNSTIIFQTASDNQGTGQTDRLATEKMRLLSSSSGRLLIGATTALSGADGLTLGGNVTRVVQMNRHLTANTAGNSLTIMPGGATVQATNKSAGSLILTSGTPTGSGTGSIVIKAAPATANTLTAIASVTVSAEGSGYTAGDVLSITGGGGSSGTATVGTVAAAGRLATIAINAAGSGYVVGDVLTIGGGSSGTATVSTVDINGGILTLALTTGGSGYSAVSAASVTGGTGTGATLTTTIHATGGILTVSVTAAGSGYALTTGAATTGGTGTGGTLNIVPWANTDNAPITVATFSGVGLDVASTKITSVLDPSNPQDAATKNYVDTTAAGTGTVTSVSVVSANGVSGSVATATTTPAITLTLGAITPTSVNGVTLSGSATPVLTVTGTTSVSGSNTGDQTNISGNAATVTTNANLTGPITSSGNATSIASQTGTGTKFVVDTSPTLVTPNIGAATGTSLNLGSGSLSTVGNIAIDSTAARDITVGRTASGAGNSLTVQAGGAQSGATNTAGGDLVLAAGITTGSVRGNIKFAPTVQGSSGTTDNTPSAQAIMFATASSQVVLALGSIGGSTSGLPTGATSNAYILTGNVAGGLGMYRHTTTNTAGNVLSVIGGGATSGATDKSGGDLKLVSGLSTGTGGANVRIQTMTRALSTGTGDNTATDRIIVTSPKSVTNNSATTLATLTQASGSVVAGQIHYAVEVTDGTDFQIEEGTISYHVTNKAGVTANNVALKSANQQAATAGTLTVTFTVTSAASPLIQVNANSSLTPSTGYPRVTAIYKNLTQQAIAIS